MEQPVINLTKLTTEQRNEKTMRLDRMSPLEIATVMNEEDNNVIKGVQAVLPEIAQVIAWATEAIAQGGRLIYMGAGTSGRLGVLDAVECPPTFGVEPEVVVGLIAGGEKAFVKAVEGAEDDPDLGRQDLKDHNLTKKDLVVGLAASGRTPYVLGGLAYAKSLGCHTAAVACNHGSEVGKAAEVAIEVVSGPEVLTGSTRLKSGTAQKMVLNMISTGAMVGMGKAYENLMVDVQQTNQKLVTRAENMVMTATGCEREAAREALSAGHGSAKTAITMLLLSCDEAAALEKLQKAGGKISAVLAAEREKNQGKGPYLLSMDGGGTATIVYVADREGKILSRLVGGPMNPNGSAKSQVRRTLEERFVRLEAEGYEAAQCLGVGLGVAGISNPSVRSFLEGIFRSGGFDCYLGFWGDDETALAANLKPGEPGAILIAGTGSICVGLDGKGNRVRAGGYGSIMDDGGSGYAIARDMMAAVVRADDGRGARTPLTELVYKELGVEDMSELIRFLYAPERTKGEIAALAKLITPAAEQEDPEALRIMETAAWELFRLSDAVLSRLPQGAKLIYSGSVLKKNHWISQRVLALLEGKYRDISWEEAAEEAALGALRLLKAELEG